jgi:hypothetical protein
MNQTTIKKISLTILATLACGAMFAQDLKIAPAGALTSAVVPYRDTNSADANITIFTNLGPTPTNLYNINGGYYVLGPTNSVGASEQWIAVPFTPKVNSHATQLEAAIQWISGVKKVNLGVYSDNAGVVGTLLPGGQGSSAIIPLYPSCCQLVKVNLIAPGVALTAATPYWLVATTDDIAAPDFTGVWQPSNTATTGADVAQGGWFTFSNLWPAGLVKGTAP